MQCGMASWHAGGTARRNRRKFSGNFRACGDRSRLDGETMIEASPSRCTPEQWTAEQAARAMGVVDEADVAATADGDGAGEAAVSKVGAAEREEPNPRGGMRWVAGGAAIAVVAAAAWWSGAGNGDSRGILVHAGADGALISGERTPSSGSGDFNSSNGSSHMKIQTTAAAALLGAAASAFQAQAGDAVQWRVEDGGNGHWYEAGPGNLTWTQAKQHAESRGGHLATVQSMDENAFILAHLRKAIYLNAWLGGYRTNDPCNPVCTWRWVDGSPWSFTNWNFGEPNDPVNEDSLEMLVASEGRWNDLPGWASNAWPVAMLEWSTDCNADNIVDYGQILSGQLADANTNGIPDCCEPGNSCCIGDIYENHIIDGGDLGVLLSEWGIVTPTTNSDLNRDGFVNGADLGMLLANWGPCGG
jgi:Lectin C-type domain